MGGMKGKTMQKASKEERLRVSAAASLLGRLGRGVPRNFSPDERERRRLQLAAVRVHRWPSAKTKGKDRA